MIRRADQLTESHFGREVTVDGLTGVLSSAYPMPNGGGIVIGVHLGHPLAWKHVASDAPVEIGPKL